MIPKIIHYCWFGGGKKSEMIEHCMSSWKKYLPDYEIVEWNESNINVNENKYISAAFKAKKWAFVSDYARLYALYTQGGIYMDTDVLVLKNLDVFLKHKFFTGFESKDSPVTAVMGATSGHNVIKELLDMYESMSFINSDGSYNMTTNTITITQYLLNKGVVPNGKLQLVGDITIYPAIVFCPNTLSMVFNINSSKSFTIHKNERSWGNSGNAVNNSFFSRFRHYLVGRMRDFIGTSSTAKLGQYLKRKK